MVILQSPLLHSPLGFQFLNSHWDFSSLQVQDLHCSPPCKSPAPYHHATCWSHLRRQILNLGFIIHPECQQSPNWSCVSFTPLDIKYISNIMKHKWCLIFNVVHSVVSGHLDSGVFPVSWCYCGNPQSLTTEIGKQSLIKVSHVLVSCHPKSQIFYHCDLCLEGRDGGGRVGTGGVDGAVSTETRRKWS